ncbi:MAG: hypothetical protein JSW51_11705 [Gemmatimonadota bacterium]|nr:MAG: hypothetical protein JSW51_11705 [Gemmatimonadota bacterium]
MVQIKRPDMSDEEWERLKRAGAGKSSESPAEEEKEKDRLGDAKISVEEHLAGLWNVLGLGD